MNLLDDRDDGGSGLSLKINQDFAAKYDAKKRGEELSKLKDKYGEDYDEEDDEESTDYSSEDSEAEFVTPEVDAAILKIIGKIRQKDSSLYTEGRDFFDEEEKQLASKAKKASKKDAKKGKKEKTVKLKDFQRNALLAGVHTQESDEEDAARPSTSSYANGHRTPAQEAEDLRNETKNAFLGAIDGSNSEEDEEDGLLVRRNDQDNSDDEDQYKRFLLENVGAEEMERALAIRREVERSEGPADGDATGSATDDDFLKNYILNRGWLDKKAKHIPTYAEIVPGDEEEVEPAPGPSGANATSILGDEDSEDEFERAEEFENRYNFRFEEQAGNEIQTHGRDAGTSLRRVDDSRKKARESAASRKAREKQERMEELKRLKNLKKQEIMDKIAKIKEVAGVDGVDFSGLDLDEDYDPSSHAAKMASVFNSGFYDEDDANGKPVWDDDIDITDIVPADKHDEAYAPGGEAYDPTEAGPSGKKSRAERKKDKKAKKKDKGKQREVEEAEVQEGEGGMPEEEPNFDMDMEEFDNIADPEERKRKVEQIMDEYYKLDYEDVIGDLPTRFHYTSSLNPAGTSADPSGLTAMEILMATDAELNEFESLRKLAPYRGQGKEGGNKKRKKVKELRKRLAQRRWGDELPDPETEAYHAMQQQKKRKRDAADGEAATPAGPPKKRMGKKERQKKQAAAGPDGVAGE